MLDAENITPDDWDDGLNSEVPSSLFMPFPDIQNAYKELKQNKNSKIKISSAFYIILESSF